MCYKLVFGIKGKWLGVGIAQKANIPIKNKYVQTGVKVASAVALGGIIGSAVQPLLRRVGLPEIAVMLGSGLSAFGLAGGVGTIGFLLAQGKLPMLSNLLPFNIGLGQRSNPTAY